MHPAALLLTANTYLQPRKGQGRVESRWYLLMLFEEQGGQISGPHQPAAVEMVVVGLTQAPHGLADTQADWVFQPKVHLAHCQRRGLRLGWHTDLLKLPPRISSPWRSKEEGNTHPWASTQADHGRVTWQRKAAVPHPVLVGQKGFFPTVGGNWTLSLLSSQGGLFCFQGHPYWVTSRRSHSPRLR